MASTVPPTRGVAFSFEVPVFDTSGKLKTGAAFSASQRSLDGAAYGAMTNAPAEIGSSGTYTIALTAAEMTADRIDGRLVVSTASCQDVYFTIFTSLRRIDDLSTLGGTAQTGDSFAQIGAAGAGLTAIPKTGYALAAGEHTAIAADAQTGLTAQGYTTARAGFLDTLSGLVASIWASVTRTLTQGAASVAAAVSGASITVYRGTSWSVALTGLTDFTGWTKLVMTAKANNNLADATALFQIVVSNPAAPATDGLQILNGAAYAGAKADGVLIVAGTTSVTLTAKPAATALLPLGNGFSYDIKAFVAGGTEVEVADGTGKLNIVTGSTGAIV